MANDILTHNFPPNLDRLWTREFAHQLAATEGAVSGLNQAVTLLHNPNLLMRPLLGKEAESSSRLEGTQASAEDVYIAELSDDTKTGDVQEIVNYQDALVHGVKMIEKRPLSQMVIRDVHKTLMTSVRGENKSPGAYRARNVWIGAQGTDMGEARYVPPEAIHISGLMQKLEDFIKKGEIHPLIASGIIHHRFEAIHPFEDGNGRTGRLIITLYLLKTGKLAKPMLYPSGYFEKNRTAYMDALHAVDTSEDWYSWLMFYLKGIEEQAKLSLKLARDIDALYRKKKSLIEETKSQIGLLNVLELCFIQPYLSVQYASTKLSLPPNSVRRYIEILEKKEILTHTSTVKRGERIYSNAELLQILRAI
jgi:Fic family protein